MAEVLAAALPSDVADAGALPADNEVELLTAARAAAAPAAAAAAFSSVSASAPEARGDSLGLADSLILRGEDGGECLGVTLGEPGTK